MSSYPKITDESEMAFGKYQGEQIGNVPAAYLLYLYDKNRAGRYKEYIEENMKMLQDEEEEARGDRNDYACSTGDFE
jgi:uncharacterized protein (DUF3820 family)